MTERINDQFLLQLTESMLENRYDQAEVLCLENGDATISWCADAGTIRADERYFIASMTKLYITALLLMLRTEGKPVFNYRINKTYRMTCSAASMSRTGWTISER